MNFGAKLLEPAIKAANLAQRKRVGSWRVTVPDWKPCSINEFSSVKDKIHLKQRDRKVVADYAVTLCGVPKAEGRRRISLEITLAPRNKEPDPDNLNKSLYDALVQCGLLVDDKVAFVETGSTTYFRGDRLQTVLVIEDLPSLS